MKYIFVTGGVMSGIGKGITASMIGIILKSTGLKVCPIKIDPYINCDAGNMSPFQHGEVYVLNDGSEVDLDLGNYERFLDVELNSSNSITTGKIYKSVIEKERSGHYLGETVQSIPHITDEIISELEIVPLAFNADVCIVELGGTVGDIESDIFLRAIKYLSDKDIHQVIFAHVTYVNLNGEPPEQKTKPTQHSIEKINKYGIRPDILFCRCKTKLTEECRNKISKMCSIHYDRVISAHDMNLYDIASYFSNECHLADFMIKCFGCDIANSYPSFLDSFARIGQIKDNNPIKIAIVGKYNGTPDTYLSITKALMHAATYINRKVDTIFCETLENVDCAGVIIPGGFGERFIDNKVNAIIYARNKGIPLLGICLGMQAMVIAASRSYKNMGDANSTEFDDNTLHPVIIKLNGELSMRKGLYKINVIDELSKIYNNNNIVKERFRHKYIINNEYTDILESLGIYSIAKSSFNKYEAIIWKNDNNSFMIGTQYHPELVSRINTPSPLFIQLLKESS